MKIYYATPKNTNSVVAELIAARATEINLNTKIDISEYDLKMIIDSGPWSLALRVEFAETTLNFEGAV